MENEQKDIFNITVNAEGVQWMLRFCRLVKTILVLSILISFVFIAIDTIWAVIFDPRIFSDQLVLRMEYSVWPYYWAVYTIVWMTQIYIYWKFSRILKKAINGANEAEFNKSFYYLYNSARVGIAALVLTLLGNAFHLFTMLRYGI